MDYLDSFGQFLDELNKEKSSGTSQGFPVPAVPSPERELPNLPQEVTEIFGTMGPLRNNSRPAADMTPGGVEGLQSVIEEQQAKDRQYQKDRGFLSGLAGDVAGGAFEYATEMVPKAVRAVTPVDSPLYRGAQSVEQWGQEQKIRHPFLEPTEAANPVSEAIHGGVRSAAQSLAAGLPAAAGAVLAAPLAGVAAGTAGLLGYATGAATQFGAAQYTDVMDRAVPELMKREGLSKEEAEAKARPAALREAGYETGFEFLSDVLGGKALGLLGGTAGAKGAVSTIKNMMAEEFKFKNVMKKVAQTFGAETGTEVLTQGLENVEERNLGLRDDSSNMEAFFNGAKDAFGPAGVASLIFAAVGLGGLKLAQRSTVKALEDGNADPVKRERAVNEIYESLREIDPKVADVWGQTASDAVQSGAPISADDDLIAQYYAAMQTQQQPPGLPPPQLKLPAPEPRQLPPGQGFTMRPPEDVYSPYSPELAQQIGQPYLPGSSDFAPPPATTPGTDFTLQGEPQPAGSVMDRAQRLAAYRDNLQARMEGKTPGSRAATVLGGEIERINNILTKMQLQTLAQETINDQENVPRIPSQIEARQEPQQTEPEQGAGREETPTGGDVQTGGYVESTSPEPAAKPSADAAATVPPDEQKPSAIEIEEAAHEAATSPRNDLPEPTQAQKEAGNYRLGHINLQGLDISIENPKGSERKGVSPEGKPWSTTMQQHYGYIKGTVGRDKDHIDTFIGDNPESQQVFVVDQVDPKTGKFDEHKVMLGFNDQQSAVDAYHSNYEKGWKGMGAVTPMEMDSFKTWIKEGDTKKPSAKQVSSPPLSEVVTPEQPSSGGAIVVGSTVSWTDRDKVQHTGKITRLSRGQAVVEDDAGKTYAVKRDKLTVTDRMEWNRETQADLRLTSETQRQAEKQPAPVTPQTLTGDRLNAFKSQWDSVSDEDIERFIKGYERETRAIKGKLKNIPSGPVTRVQRIATSNLIDERVKESSDFREYLKTRSKAKTAPTMIETEQGPSPQKEVGKERKTGEPKPPSDGSLGINEEGNPVFQDEAGNRYFVRDGVRVSAPRKIGPRGEQFQADMVEDLFRKGRTEYLTKEELEARTAGKQKQESTLVPKETVKAGGVEFEVQPLVKKGGRPEPKVDLSNILKTSESPSQQVASWVKDQIQAGKSFTGMDLFSKSVTAFGGTQAQGKFTPKDAYDAMEMGVNQYIMEHPGTFDLDVNAKEASIKVADLRSITSRLATQSKRTAEMDEFQQFSTPPPLAYVANWVAKPTIADTVLEPSAGVGGIAAFAKNSGAKVVVNELSPRRYGLLQQMDFDTIFNENAEQLNNILPPDVKPTVVVMNPPFSATAGRITGQRKTMNATAHIEQALARLKPGGRLVAIVGRGMSMDAPTFKAWWVKIQKQYDVRADLGVSGKDYGKYGTHFDNRILVIDKTEPVLTREVVRGDVADALEALAKLQEVRDDRPSVTEPGRVRPAERPSAQPGGETSTPQGQAEGKPGRASRPAVDAVGVRGQEVSGEGRQSEGVRGEPSDVAARGRDVSSRGNVERGGEQPLQEPQGEPGGAGARSRGTSSEPTISDREVRSLETEQASKRVLTEQEIQQEAQQSDEAVYDRYSPTVTIKGANPHPGNLVESAAMASVDAPPTKYQPSLPGDVISQGKLSDAQLESVIRAGNAHETMLDDGKRQGYFIGDGTGVGKGREISGIFLDNWNKGRRKGVWLSANSSLFHDAQRDMKGVGDDPEKLFNLGKVKTGTTIQRDTGIVFGTYDLLKRKAGEKGAQEYIRMKQIADWLGKDFDGVIVFDEAHKMGNAIPMEGDRGRTMPSATALAGVDLQNLLPKARIVYVSATGATEVMNLGYATRLGLWGEGTPFARVHDFISEISAGGIAAMELVARDLKAMGKYLARSLSYHDVTYERLEHGLTEGQKATYDRLAEGWQSVLQNIGAALEETKGKRGAAMSAFWGAHQRFFNQVVTSLQMPTILKKMHEVLDRGDSAVLQIVNTNEASLTRKLAELTEDDTLEELDMTPRDQLMQYIERSFPVQQFEEYEDEEGRLRTRPVVDSQGNPVENAAAVAMRDRLLDELGSIKVPDGPLDMVLNEFGAKSVAEVTGRTQRVVVGQDGKRVKESRSKAKTEVEAKDFQDGKRRILIFSNAGGTGLSYHADLNVKNQQKRVHFLVQPGWQANAAVQGFGRTHRTNQKQAPHYILVTTDLKGQKRFISSIARRLDQLGALTKGQRQTGSQGFFEARDNLESDYARDALTQFLNRLVQEREVGGVTLDAFQEQTGIKLLNGEGNATRNYPSMPQFLNRLLSMTYDMQNKTFDAFSEVLDAVVEREIRNGTLDRGIENLKGDRVELANEQMVHADKKTGAETKYVELDVTNPAPVITFDRSQMYAKAGYFQNVKSGRVWAANKSVVRTKNDGEVVSEHAMNAPTGAFQKVRAEDLQNAEKWKRLTEKAARDHWQTEYDSAPKTVTERKHMITGAILPIWDRLSGNPKVLRVITKDGQKFLGRIIEPKDLQNTLTNLGARGSLREYGAEELIGLLDRGYTLNLANRWKIKTARVSGELRTEVIGPDYQHMRELEKAGIFTERIQYKTRFFVPAGEGQTAALEQVVKNRPVVETVAPVGRGQEGRVMGSIRPSLTAPPFYSQLQRILEKKLPNAGTSRDFANAVDSWAKKGEFKSEELEWSGLKEWLSEQQGKVTKQEVLDFLKANQIEVKEVEKGETDAWVVWDGEENQYFGSKEEAESYAKENEIEITPDTVFMEAGSGSGGTKFHQYTLPGGENYRELLMTLPSTRRDKMAQAYKDLESGKLDDNEYRSLMDRLRKEETEYTSSHWDEPNVLAHVRMNDRTDVDGKKVLFIEEIQSDWHQEGRKKGYKKQNELPPGWKRVETSGGPRLEDPEGNWHSVDESITFSQPVSGMVPNAPFKTTWPILAFKRALRYAAENGFDRVAWTTGEQQAERYDLSKQVDAIYAAKDKDFEDSYNVDIEKDGDIIDNKELLSPQELEAYIGKELAQKIVDQAVEPGKEVEFRGLDLKVGGEGMKGFYDKILPSEVNKYVKKWGGKVGETKIEVSDGLASLQKYVGPEYSADEIKGLIEKAYQDNTPVMFRQQLRAVEYKVRHGETFTSSMEKVGSEGLAKYLGGKMEIIKGSIPVHSIDITDSMRESALQGQPLFRKSATRPTLTDAESQTKHDAMVQILSPIASKLRNVNIGFVRSVRDLPPNVLNRARSLAGGDFETVQSQLRGAYDIDSGKTWIITDNNTDSDEAQATIFHEAFHGGLRQVLPDTQYRQFMGQAAQYFGNDGLSEIASTYKLDLGKNSERLLAAEERIAQMAETERPGWLDRLYAAIRNALRKMGFTIKFSDADIRGLIGRANRAANRGATREAGEIRASLKQSVSDEIRSTLKAASRAMRPKDVTFIENILRSPEYWKHPAEREAFQAAQDREERRHEILVKYKDTLDKLADIRKTSPADYAEITRLTDYMDVNEVKWDSIRDEQKGKLSDKAVEAVDGMRKAYDDLLEYMRRPVKEVIEYLDKQKEKTGEEDPSIEVPAKDGRMKKFTRSELLKIYQNMGQLKGFYAPRNRESGEYFLTAKDKDGQFYRFHKPSVRQIEKLRLQLGRQGYTDFSSGEIAKLPEEIQMGLNIVDMGKAIEHAIDTSKMDDPETKAVLKAEALESASNMLKARAFRAHKIARTGRGEGNVVKGYIEDPLERLSLYLSQISGGVAKGEAGNKMMNALAKIEATREPKRYVRLRDYIQEQMRNADRWDRKIAMAKSVVSLKYLGFNPRSALVNVTAQFTTAPPAILKYALDNKGSMIRIMRTLNAAGVDYGRYMVGKAKLTENEQRFLDEIKAKGIDNPQLAREAMRHVETNFGKAWAKTMKGAMWLFSRTEQWNRGTTLLAAYRLARKQGTSYEDAVEKAKLATDRAHGVYGKASLPSWAVGSNPAAKIAQMGYTFSKFSHNYLQMLYDHGLKKESAKGLVFALTAPAILGGTTAFAGYAVLMGIARGIMKAGGDDRDPEKMFFEWIRKYFGDEGEKAARYGALGSAGVDVTGSLAIGLELPKNLLDLTGPFGGVLQDLGKAAHYAGTGQAMKAAEKLAPAFAGNVLRAVRELDSVTTSSGKQVWDKDGRPYKPTEVETAKRVLGFRPSDRAMNEERQFESRSEMANFSERRNAIYERYKAYLSSREKDPEELKEIMDRVAAYNASVLQSGRMNLIPRITRTAMKTQARKMLRPMKRERAMLESYAGEE